MKCLIVLSALVAVTLNQPLDITEEDLNQWQLFKIAYEREYDNEEYRKQVFLNNLKYIQAHNAKYERGESTYELGVNQFADMTFDEFVAKYATSKVSNRSSENEEFTAQDGVSVPKSMDWRKKGAVTEVKYKQSCGSSWAFSAAGSIEGQHFLKTKKLVSLSAQNLVDCAYPTFGCNGGEVDTAFKYVVGNKGIDSDDAYPYSGSDHNDCRYNPKKSVTSVSSFVDIQSGSEKALLQAVANIGPISANVDVSEHFMRYKRGVLNDPLCSNEWIYLDHSLLVVGYGHQEKGGDYWLVKDSYGKGFGMKGYVMMSRNKKNQCGIATAASYPKI